MERQIQALQAAIPHAGPPGPQQQQALPQGYPQPAPFANMGGTQGGQDITAVDNPAHFNPTQSQNIAFATQQPQQQQVLTANMGLVDMRGYGNKIVNTIDDNTAKLILDDFVESKLPHAPFINFDKSIDVTALRNGKPSLFGVLLYIGSAVSHEGLHNAITYEVLSGVAQKVLVYGTRSLEMLQCLQLLAVWINRTDDWTFMRLYEQNSKVMLASPTIRKIINAGIDKSAAKKGPVVSISSEAIDNADALQASFLLESL